MKKSIAFALVCFLSILSFTSLRADEGSDKENILCEQAFELIQAHLGDSSFVIIDFRPIEKYKNAYLENAIFHDVFLDDIDEWLDALDKDKTYLIYCTIGHRSGIALVKMREMGFKNVYHMYEGVRKWKELGYETLSLED
jgi:rhodanese-related sulfurtransferase